MVHSGFSRKGLRHVAPKSLQTSRGVLTVEVHYCHCTDAPDNMMTSPLHAPLYVRAHNFRVSHNNATIQHRHNTQAKTIFDIHLPGNLHLRLVLKRHQNPSQQQNRKWKPEKSRYEGFCWNRRQNTSESISKEKEY